MPRDGAANAQNPHQQTTNQGDAPSYDSVIEWATLTWLEAAEVLKSRPVALLPLGAVEEHGPHLPLGADTLAATALARRLAAATGAVLLPTLPYGQVWSLSRFPGSLSVSNGTLSALVHDVAAELARQGFRALVLLTAHLGNLTALKETARHLHEALSHFPVLYLFYPGLQEAADGVRTSAVSHPGILHADEIETSLLLALAPEAVHMERAVAEYPVFPPDFDVRPVRWHEISTSGVFGDPTQASAEKGERLLAAVLAQATALVRRL
jgi:creatinine amidohydrolase